MNLAWVSAFLPTGQISLFFFFSPDCKREWIRSLASPLRSRTSFLSCQLIHGFFHSRQGPGQVQEWKKGQEKDYYYLFTSFKKREVNKNFTLITHNHWGGGNRERGEKKLDWKGEGQGRSNETRRAKRRRHETVPGEGNEMVKPSCRGEGSGNGIALPTARWRRLIKKGSGLNMNRFFHSKGWVQQSGSWSSSV